MIRVGIHQPNFFPWLGYFLKWHLSDRFVLLDDVQYPRAGSGTWVNRTRLLIGGSAQWATASVNRMPGAVPIMHMQYNDTVDWRRKIMRSLEVSYAKAPHFQATSELIFPLLASDESNIAVYNETALVRIAEALGLDTAKVVRSSKLPSKGASTERLVSLVQAVGGDTYMSGDGAAGYQEDDLFAEAGLGIQKLNFVHPAYPQPAAEFVAGLSIIDALMNCGADGTRSLLLQAADNRDGAGGT